MFYTEFKENVFQLCVFASSCVLQEHNAHSIWLYCVPYVNGRWRFWI